MSERFLTLDQDAQGIVVGLCKAAKSGKELVINGTRYAPVKTCHDTTVEASHWFICSECMASDKYKHPRFCHGCGAKVVDE